MLKNGNQSIPKHALKCKVSVFYMLKTKKGVSGHIEMIISFLIFLAFVSFLLFFVNPIEKNKETTHYLDIAEQEIIENVTANLTVFSVTVDETTLLSIGNCFCFPYSAPYKVIARDENGNPASAMTILASSKICVKPTVKSDGVTKNKFYKLYFSDEITTESVGACTGIPPASGGADIDLTSAQYQLGVLNEYKKASNKSLYMLNWSYNTKYKDLRDNSLKLNTDLNIFVKDMKAEYLVYGKIKEPKASNVMAKDIPIEVINDKGEIIPAIMNIQVWE